MLPSATSPTATSVTIGRPAGVGDGDADALDEGAGDGPDDEGDDVGGGGAVTEAADPTDDRAAEDPGAWHPEINAEVNAAAAVAASSARLPR